MSAYYNAPDWGSGGPNGGGPPPLSDFFQLTTARTFVPVQTYPYLYNCFQGIGACPAGALPSGTEDPDDY